MDEKTQLLLSVGHHLRQLLLKRAQTSATIDKACSGYLEYLYIMRNSTASVNHLVLHFTTFNIKGRNKLGEIISSNALAANIGCELIDFVERRRKTGPVKDDHGVHSVSSDSTVNISRDKVVKTNLPDTASTNDQGVSPMETTPVVTTVEKIKKSRWKRFKEKMARTSNNGKVMQTSTARHFASCEPGASVAASSAPAALRPVLRIPDGHAKVISTSVLPEEKMLDKRINEAGYVAYQRISEGTSANPAQDMEAIARARNLPLRIPLSREMEATVRGKPVQPSYNIRGPKKKQKPQHGSPSQRPATAAQRKAAAKSQRRIAEAMRNPSALAHLTKKERNAFLTAMQNQKR